MKYIGNIFFLLLLIFAAIKVNADLDCASTPLALGCLSNNLSGGGEIIVQFLLALAFVSGWGFIVAAIFKFKQVRENPTQVPVSTPFAFLLTAILLIFIPGLMSTGSVTLFGTGEAGAQSLQGNQAAAVGLIKTTVDVTVKEASSEKSENTFFGMAARATELFPSLMLLVTGGAYIAGLGFAIAAMTKLKAVKDNPQQNPVTMPLAYLAVAVLLVFMPDLIDPTASTLFGTGDDFSQEGGAQGQGSSQLFTTPSPEQNNG